jgi:hypothetical protein
MARKVVTLYKPDGSKISYSDVSSVTIEDRGTLVIRPGAGTGQTPDRIVTSLPFTIDEFR